MSEIVFQEFLKVHTLFNRYNIFQYTKYNIFMNHFAQRNILVLEIFQILNKQWFLHKGLGWSVAPSEI